MTDTSKEALTALSDPAILAKNLLQDRYELEGVLGAGYLAMIAAASSIVAWLSIIVASTIGFLSMLDLGLLLIYSLTVWFFLEVLLFGLRAAKDAKNDR